MRSFEIADPAFDWSKNVEKAAFDSCNAAPRLEQFITISDLFVAKAARIRILDGIAPKDTEEIKAALEAVGA